MDEEDECIHGLGLKSACTICNGKDKRQELVKWEVEYRFPAKFDSECAKCDGAMWIGEIIAKCNNGKYICLQCSIS